MSAALLCEDTHLDRRVILKTLQAGEEARRLVDEQKALLKLRSKHVVQLLDVVPYPTPAGDVPALVLEFIEGDDLKVGSLAPDQAYLLTLWQIASGLSDIHAQGVVHRDIKPNNIRRDINGVIKILDFGLSRTLGIDTQTNNAIGALPFMAPEFFVTKTIHFSEKADVYAFGVTALSLADAGLPAWSLAGPATRPPANAVSTHIPNMDHGIVDILQRCLLVDPNDRPGMFDVAAELERVLLRGRHQARVSLMSSVYEINSSKPLSRPTVTVGGKPVAGIGIEYDGFLFKVTMVLGQVRLNNVPTGVGQTMPDACVIEFPLGSRNSVYATFDVSHPEVML
ncbi:MAG: serine/threonine protein kinase [Sphingomonadales bacterium]|nr:MAG: serine/threonine protein kinase [Sphingomonadales bacterium]